jgi:CBS-domain-containing membrane protein
MSRPVHTLLGTDSIERAAALLESHGITAAPVLDADFEVIGMVSEVDLLQGRIPAPAAGLARPATVAEVMSRPVVSTGSDADLGEAAHAMLFHDVHSVPVIDDGELVGIVSRRDLLRTLVRDDQVLCTEVQQRLDEYAGVPRRWTATVTGGVALIVGDFDDEADRTLVPVLARTVPGVVDATISAHRGERFECG